VGGFEKVKYLFNKKSGSSGNLQVIKCFCGAEILMIPGVKVMNTAIEAHVDKHKKLVMYPANVEAEAERIREYLIIQLFDKASQV
jgi:hypothetical protein